MKETRERVNLWRPVGVSGVVCLTGTTDRYVVDPNGEMVLGQVTAGAMLAHRGRDRHVVATGDTCAWDASAKHEGIPYGGAQWGARLIVLEAPAVDRLWDDEVGNAMELGRRDPVIRDPAFARRFAAIFRALASVDMVLAVEEALIELVASLSVRRARPRVLAARRDPALRRARELLVDEAHRNITLDELATVAGTSRHRLARLFRSAYGLPPHRLQLAARISRARRLLERGMPPAGVAQQVGFVDQSHLHRHFCRRLGMTPGRYLELARSNVQDVPLAGGLDSRHRP
jgi:AraC-like DNA-binding protein